MAVKALCPVGHPAPQDGNARTSGRRWYAEHSAYPVFAKTYVCSWLAADFNPFGLIITEENRNEIETVSYQRVGDAFVTHFRPNDPELIFSRSENTTNQCQATGFLNVILCIRAGTLAETYCRLPQAPN